MALIAIVSIASRNPGSFYLPASRFITFHIYHYYPSLHGGNMAAMVPGSMSTIKSGKEEKEIPASFYTLFSMKEKVFPEIDQQKLV